MNNTLEQFSLLSEKSNKTSTTKCSSSTPPIELSEMDRSIQIHTERMTSILNEVIYKTEISIVLLNIDESCEDILGKFNDSMTEEEFLLFKNLMNNVPLDDYQISDEHQEITDVLIQEYKNDMTNIFPELSQLFWIIVKHKELEPVIKSKIEFLRNSKEESVKNLIAYLDTLVRYKNKMIERLCMSAAEKLKRELAYRHLCLTNKSLISKISDLTKKLESEKETFKLQYDEKESIIKARQEELDSMRENCKNIISDKLIEIRNQMEKFKNASITKCNILLEKYKESKRHYDKFLVHNMACEKEAKEKRVVVEKDLLKWISKYDEDIGGKHIFLEELTKSYEEEKLQYENLEFEFEEQETVYVPMMAEKQAEYERQILDKMKAFLREHAARVLQRAWRRTLLIRAEKKKKKGGKKKKAAKKNVVKNQVNKSNVLTRKKN